MLKTRMGFLWIFVIIVSVHASETVKINISNKTLLKESEFNPIGTQAFGGIGYIEYAEGNLILDSGFEPVEKRDLRRIVKTGKDERGKYFQIDQAGTSLFATYYNGTYSGTTFRAYRMVDSKGNKLPLQKEENKFFGPMVDTANATEMIDLGEFSIPPRGAKGFPDGGWEAYAPDTFKEYVKMRKDDPKSFAAMEDKWRVYYTSDKDLYLDDIVIFIKRDIQFSPKDFHPRTRHRYQNQTAGWVGTAKLTKVAHSQPLPNGIDGGESCLMIEADKDKKANLPNFLWYKMFGGKDPKANPSSHWYGQLEPGVKYVVQTWIRQEGYSNDPQIRLGFSDNAGRRGYMGTVPGKEFTVGKQWQKIGFMFTAPESPDGKQNNCGVSITFPDGGKLYIDNARISPVYAPGDEDKEFVVNKTILKTFLKSQPQSGRKGTWRTWSAHNEINMLDNLDWSVRILGYPSLPKTLETFFATGNSPQTRVIPWINTQIMHTPEDHRGLIEYLTAPYNPKTDTPKSKPYAAKRHKQRGHGRPWVDDFREIIVELGNEGWHNRKGPTYIGVGRYGAVHKFGKDYGLYCRMMIKEMRKSPYLKDEAAKKIKFGINANYSAKVTKDGIYGFGPEATQACKIHDLETHANYYGPRWELNETQEKTANDTAYQKYLVSGLQSLQDQYKGYEDALAYNNKALGTNIQIAGYEGGASGYSIKTRMDRNHPSQLIGRSKVAAIAGVDAWMQAYLNGWKYQTNFVFRQGNNWCLFNSMGERYNPLPSWIAMSMINRVANGDIVEVNVSDTPTLSYTETDKRMLRRLKNEHKPATTEFPLIGSYARRKGKHWSVIVINRSLDQQITTDITLPFTEASKITRHWLSGSAKERNNADMKVDWKREDVAAENLKQGTLSLTCEPSSMQIFEFMQK